MSIKRLLGPSSSPSLTLVLAGISILIFMAMMSPYRKAKKQIDLLEPQVKGAVAAEKFDRFCALEIKEVIDLALAAGTGKARHEELDRHSIHIGPVRAGAEATLRELQAMMKDIEQLSPDDAEGMREGMRLVNEAEKLYKGLEPIEEVILETARNSEDNEAASAIINRLRLLATRAPKTVPREGKNDSFHHRTDQPEPRSRNGGRNFTALGRT